MGFPSGTLERWLRRGRRRLFRPRVDFVYSRRYQIELPGAAYDNRRGERILTFLDSSGLLDAKSVHRPEPATFRHLRRVHSDDYLDSLNQPGSLTSVIGFAIAEHAADRILDAQRAMAGGTLMAARLALGADREDGGIAINLGGGLHHAFADKGERFCVFNDVAVAVADLRHAGYGGRILVVDLDLHDGDGTRALFAADPTVHTFSIHNQTNGTEDAIAATIVELPGEVEDGDYLEALRSRLPGLLKSFDPGLVIYLAGCDPAADDQIGNWKISAEGMLERDLYVAAKVRERRLPLVVVLAGGYGFEAWRYSARFLSTLLNRGRPVEPPSTEEITLVRYRQLARELAPHELTGEGGGDGERPGDDDWGLTAEDILPGLAAPHRSRRLLGYYSLQGLELALERAGILDRLRSLGFSQPTLEIDLDNPSGDTVRLYGDETRSELLLESRVRIDRATVPHSALLRIEWLLMQNPRASFTPQRPRLPGQKHPGLGILPDIMALLVLACERLQLEGLLFVPAHFNTATQGRRYLRVLAPEDEAFLRALEKALAGMSLSEASHSVDERRVLNRRTGLAEPWRSMPMVYPLSERLRGLVAGDDYERKVAEAAAGFDLKLT